MIHQIRKQRRIESKNPVNLGAPIELSRNKPKIKKIKKLGLIENMYKVTKTREDTLNRATLCIH